MLKTKVDSTAIDSHLPRLQNALEIASSTRSHSAIRSAVYRELHTLRSICATTSLASQASIASTDAVLRTLFATLHARLFTRSVLVLLAETYIALFRLLPTVSMGSNSNGGACGAAVRAAIDYYSKLAAGPTPTTLVGGVVSSTSHAGLSTSPTGARTACIFLCGELCAAFGSFAVAVAKSSSSNSASSQLLSGAENALTIVAKICIKKSSVGGLFAGIGGLDSSSDASHMGIDSGSAIRAAAATALYRIIEGCGTFFQSPGKPFQTSIKALQSVARDPSFAVRATVGPLSQSLACSFAVHGLLTRFATKQTDSISMHPSGSPLAVLLDLCEAGLTDPHPTVRLGCAFGLASVLATAVSSTKVGTVAAEAAAAALRTMALRGAMNDAGDVDGDGGNDDSSGGGGGGDEAGYSGGDGIDGFEGGEDGEGGDGASSTSKAGSNSNSFSTPPRGAAVSKTSSSKQTKSAATNDNFAKSFRKIGSSLQDAVARTARTLGPGNSGALGGNRGVLQTGLVFTTATAVQYVSSLIRSSGKLAANGSGAKAGDIRAAAAISCASLLRSIRGESGGLVDAEVASVISAALSPLARGGDVHGLAANEGVGVGKRTLVSSGGINGGGVVLASPTSDVSSVSGGLPIAGPAAAHARSCVLHVLESGLAEPPHSSAASYNHEAWARWLKMLLSETTSLLIKQANNMGILLSSSSSSSSSTSSGLQLMSASLGARGGGGAGTSDSDSSNGLLTKVLGSAASSSASIQKSASGLQPHTQSKTVKTEAADGGIMNRFASSFRLGGQDTKKRTSSSSSSSSSSSASSSGPTAATSSLSSSSSSTTGQGAPLFSLNSTSVLLTFAVSLLPRCGMQQGGDEMRTAVSLLLSPCLAFVGAPSQTLRASAIKALVILAKLNPTSLPDLVMACTATIRHAHAQLASPSAHAATAAAAASTALADAANFSALRRSSIIAMSGAAGVSALNTGGAGATTRGFLSTLGGAASTAIPSDSTSLLCSLSLHGGGSPLTSSSLGFGTPGSGKGSGLGVCGEDDSSELLKMHSFSIALSALVSLSSELAQSPQSHLEAKSLDQGDNNTALCLSILPPSLIQDVLQLTSVLLSVGRDDRLSYGGSSPAAGSAADAAAIAALQHGTGAANSANNPVAALAQSAAAAAAAEVEACCVRAGFGIMTSLCCLGPTWLSNVAVWPVIYTLLTDELIRFVKDADRSGVGSSRDGSGAFLLSPLGVPPAVATATTLIAQATSHSTSSASAIALGGAGLSSVAGESPLSAALSGILGGATSGAYDGLGLAMARSTYCGVSNAWTVTSLPIVALALFSVIKTATANQNALHTSASLQEAIVPLMQLGLTILTEQRIVPASLAAVLSSASSTNTRNNTNGNGFNNRLAAFSDAETSLSLRPSSSQFITLGPLASTQSISSANLHSSDPSNVVTASAMAPPVVRGVSWGADDASLYSPCGVSLSAIAISRKSYLQAAGFLLEAAALLPLSSMHFLPLRGPLLSASVAALTGGAMTLIPLEIGLVTPSFAASTLQKQQNVLPNQKPRAPRVLPSSTDADRAQRESIEILMNRSSTMDPEICATWSPLVLALAHSPVPSISKRLLCARGGEDFGAGAPLSIIAPHSKGVSCDDSYDFGDKIDQLEETVGKAEEEEEEEEEEREGYKGSSRTLNAIFYPSVVDDETDFAILSRLCLQRMSTPPSIPCDASRFNFSGLSSWESANAVASILDHSVLERKEEEEEETNNDLLNVSKTLRSVHTKSALRFPTLHMTKSSSQRLGHAAVSIVSSLLPQLPLGQANSLVVALSAPLKLAASLTLLGVSADERDRSHISSLNETLQISSTGTGFRISPLSLSLFDSDASSRNMAAALLCLVSQLRPEHALSPYQDESSGGASALPVQWLLSARTGIAAGLSHPNHEVRLACAEGLAELCRVCGPFSSFSRKLILTLQRQAGLTSGSGNGSNGDLNETSTTLSSASSFSSSSPSAPALLAPATMSGVLCAISRIAYCTTSVAIRSSHLGSMIARTAARHEKHRFSLLLANRALCKDHGDANPFFFDETDPDEEIVPSAFSLAEPLLSRIAIDALSAQLLLPDIEQPLLGALLHAWATALWAVTSLVREEEFQLNQQNVSTTSEPSTSSPLIESLALFKRFIGPTLSILNFHIASTAGSFSSPFDSGVSPLVPVKKEGSTASSPDSLGNSRLIHGQEGIDTSRLPSLLLTQLGSGSGASSVLYDGNGLVRSKVSAGVQQPASPAGLNVASALGSNGSTAAPALIGFATHVTAAHGYRFPGGGGVAVADRLGGVVAISEAADLLASKGAFVQSQGSGNWRPHNLSTAAVLPIFHPATGEVLPSPLMITSLEGAALALHHEKDKDRGAFSLLGSAGAQEDGRGAGRADTTREEGVGGMTSSQGRTASKRAERALMASLGDIRAHWRAVGTAGGQAAVRAVAAATVSSLEQSGGPESGSAVLPISGYSGCDEGNVDCNTSLVLSGILRSLLVGLTILARHSPHDDEKNSEFDKVSVISQCSFIWSSLCSVPSTAVARNCVRSLALLSELVQEPEGAMRVLLPFALSVARAAVAGPGGVPSHSSPGLLNESTVSLPLFHNPINGAIEAVSLLPVSPLDSSKMIEMVGAVGLGCERLGMRWAPSTLGQDGISTPSVPPAASLYGRYCAAAVVGAGLSSGLVPCASLDKSSTEQGSGGGGGGEDLEDADSSSPNAGASDGDDSPSGAETNGPSSSSSSSSSSSVPSPSLLGQVLGRSLSSGRLGRRPVSAISSVPLSMQSPASSGLALLSARVNISDISALLSLLEGVLLVIKAPVRKDGGIKNSELDLLPLPFPGVDMSLGIAGDVLVALDVLAGRRVQAALTLSKRLLQTTPDVFLPVRSNKKKKKNAFSAEESKVVLLGAEWLQCLCDAILHESSRSSHRAADAHARLAAQEASNALIAQASKKAVANAAASSDFGPSGIDDRNEVSTAVNVKEVALTPTAEYDLLQFDSDTRRGHPPEDLSLEFVSIYPILALDSAMWRFIGNYGIYLALEAMISTLSNVAVDVSSSQRPSVFTLSESLLSSILRAACACVASDGGLDDSEENGDSAPAAAALMTLQSSADSRASSRSRISGLRLILALLKATRNRADKDIPSQHCLQQHQALLLGALLPCLSSSSVSLLAQNLASTAILRCISIGVFTGAGAAKRITKSYLSAWASEPSFVDGRSNRGKNGSTLLDSISGLLLLAIFVPGRANVMFESRFPQTLIAYEDELTATRQPSFGVIEKVLTVMTRDDDDDANSQWFSNNQQETVIRLPPVFREAVVSTMIPSLSALIRAWTSAREENSDGRISILSFRALSAAAWLTSLELPFPLFTIDSCSNRFSSDVIAQFAVAEKSFKGVGVTTIALASAVVSKSQIVFLLPLVSKFMQGESNEFANLISSTLCDFQPELASSFHIAKAMLTSGCASSLCRDESSTIVAWMSSSLTASLASKTDAISAASFWKNVLLPFVDQTSSSTNAIQRFLTSLWTRVTLSTKDDDDDVQRIGSLSGMSAFLTSSLSSSSSSTLSLNALSLAQLSMRTSVSILKELQNNTALADCSVKDIERPNRDASLVFALITAASSFLSSFSAHEIPDLLKSCLPLLICFMQPGQQQQNEHQTSNDSNDSPLGSIDTGWVSKATALFGAQCAFAIAKRSPVAFKAFIQELDASGRRATFETAMRAGLASNTAGSLEPLPTRFKGFTSSPSVSSQSSAHDSTTTAPSLGSFKLLAKKFSTASTTQSAPIVSASNLVPSISLLQVDEEEDWMVAARKARDAERDDDDDDDDKEEEEEEGGIKDEQKEVAEKEEEEEEKVDENDDNRNGKDDFADEKGSANEHFPDENHKSAQHTSIVKGDDGDDDFADFDSAPSFPSSSTMVSPYGKSVSADAESYSPAQPVAISQDGVVDLPDVYDDEDTLQRMSAKKELVPYIDDRLQKEEEEDFGDFEFSKASDQQQTNVEVLSKVVGINSNDDDDFGDLEDGFTSSASVSVAQPQLASTINVDDENDNKDDDNDVNDDDEFGELS